MSALLRFGWLVLRVTPRRAWWIVAGLGFGVTNLVFSHEIWPSTPLAVVILTMWTISCGLLLPWLAARVAWLVADEVESYFWKVLWRLAAILGYGGATLATLVALIALLFKL